MKIRIFNHDEDLTTSRNFIDIEDMDDFLLTLLFSEGEEDKPVRIIVDEQNHAVLVKFGTMNRLNCVDDEIHNLELLSSLKLRHLARFEFKSFFADACILGVEYIRPYYEGSSKISSFRDLCKTRNSMNIKYAFFQVLITLCYLQKKFPGFRHNDLKADNVLIEKSLLNDIIYSITLSKKRKSYRLKNCTINAKIIDFELANSTNNEIRSYTVKKNEDNMKNEFGLSEERCDFFDIHLLIYDITRYFKDNEFFSFVTDFIPVQYFYSPNITNQSRLTLESQRYLQNKIKENVLYDMLSHPYFFDIRDDNLEEFDVIVDLDDINC